MKILLFFLFASSCLAQSSAGGGSMQGTVKDATGAILPNAKLTILHLETGRATTTESNTEGYFSTPTLNIGKYKVRVEAAGMKTWEGEVLLDLLYRDWRQHRRTHRQSRSQHYFSADAGDCRRAQLDAHLFLELLCRNSCQSHLAGHENGHRPR